MARSANLERWTDASGRYIGLKRLSSVTPSRGSVLILYGNGDLAVNYSYYAGVIQSVAPLDVFILEYPGYGDRSGSPTQSSLFQAASEAFRMLPAGKPIYLFAQSLGTGVASYLAGTESTNVAGVILVSPYNRLTDVAQFHMPLLPVHLLLLDRFPSEKYLRNYHGPLGVVVDGHDKVVPERFGLRLFIGYAGPKKLWDFDSGEHTEIDEPQPEFWTEVLDFWQANKPTLPGN